MNEWNLRVKGGNENVERIDPVFVWDAPDGMDQFAVEVSYAEDFVSARPVILRTTHERFFVYDGGTLQPECTYYVRVRYKLGPWSTASFTTGK